MTTKHPAERDEFTTLHVASLILVALYGVGQFALGETVPAGGGLGWDGQVYGRLVRSMGEEIAAGQLSQYYAGRILPSLAVRIALQALSIEPTNWAIIQAFRVLATVMMLIASLAWMSICDSLSLGWRGRLIGWFGLFINFCMAKQSFYYPVLTDVTAVCLATVMAAAYLRGSLWILLLATVAGSLVWQTLNVYGVLLILAPYRGVREPVAREATRWSMRSLGLLAIGIAALASVGALGALMFGAPEVAKYQARRFATGLPSLVLTGVAIWMLVFARGLDPYLAWFRRGIGPRIWLAVGLALLLPRMVIWLIANPAVENISGVANLIQFILYPPGVRKVFLPIVSIVVFWGPISILAIALWRRVADRVHALGLGFVGIVAISLPLVLACEPRFIAGAWPFLVVGVASMLDQEKVRPAFVSIFAVVSVLLAQFWLPLNYAPWPSGDLEGLLEFPKQLYAMHYGWLMNWTTFIAQSVIVICMAWILIWMLGRPGRDAGPRSGERC